MISGSLFYGWFTGSQLRCECHKNFFQRRADYYQSSRPHQQRFQDHAQLLESAFVHGHNEASD